nr:PAS domain S-box protein [uncultured Sulfurimonas sp.]
MLKKLSEKNKTLLFVISSLFIFSLILIVTIYVNQKNKLEKLEEQYYKNTKKSYEKILEKHKAFYEFRLKSNIKSQGVLEAFAKRDKEKLFELIQGRWSVLKEENKYLKIMHFHLPNGESFLRMHKPEKYGDNIAKRRAMADAMHKVKKPLYGFEAGTYMLAYRNFLPIFYKNEYIGAVEFGSRPDQILHEINYYNNIKGSLFVKDDKIIEYKEKSDLTIDGFRLQYSTLENENLIRIFALDNHLKKDTTFEINDKTYAVYIFNLGDYKGKTSAKAVFFHDITDVKAEFINTLTKLCILIICLLGILITVINLGFKSTIEKIEKTNQELDKNKKFTNSILTNSAHAIIASDLNGKITLFNKKAQELLGYSSDELVGKTTPLIFHKQSEIIQRAEIFSNQFHIKLEPNFEVLITKTNNEMLNDDEWTYITKNGVEVPVSLHITTLTDLDGNVNGYLGIAEDIRAKKILENNLQEQKNELETIFQTTKDGIAILDLETNFLFFNDAYLKMTGFTKDELLQKNCTELSAVEYLDKTKKTILEVLEKGHVENFEKTCIVKNGKRVKINMSISLMPDGQKLLLSARDITESKEKERLISEYVKLIDKNIITSSTDLDGNITYVSEAFCKISNYTKEELLGKNHKIIKHPDASNNPYNDLWKTITNNETWTGELKNKTKNGGYYWVQATISPIFNEAKEKIGYTAIRQDITDKKRVELISITDGLTNIYNRRHFNDIFPKMIKDAKHSNELLSLLIIDIDHFKDYNDTYGHQMGDIALIEVAQTIQNSLNKSDDYCFRLGGEEFGVLYKTKTKNDSLNFANKIKQNIEKLHIEHSKNSASNYITASMGLVCKNALEMQSDDTIYKETDDLLYKAKESGRNRVVTNLI